MPRHLVCLGFDLVARSDADALVADDTVDADDISVAAARVLDLLADRGLVATWFVTADALARAGGLAARLMRDGHEIALLASASADIDAVARGAAAIAGIAGTAPRGVRAPGHHAALWVPGPGANGFAYDASQQGLSWWPRRRDGAGEPGPSAADVITMPIVLSLSAVETTPARAVMQEWSDELLQMCDSMNFGVLTCAMPLAVIGRGAMLRAFSTFLDTAAACGAAVVTFEAAAREAAERIGREGS